MDGLGLHAAKRELTEPEGRNEDGELAEANMLKDVEPVTQEQCVTLERLDRTKAEIATTWRYRHHMHSHCG